VLYFLLRRNYHAAAVMAAAFLSATGLGFLLAPRDSTRYWTSVVFNTERIGGLAYAGNQNIAGVLARAGLVPGTLVATVTGLGLSILVLAVSCRGMWRAFAAGQDSLALTLNAFAVLLVSPVSACDEDRYRILSVA
jgi:alpha-1,2-mannosyltransferase